MTCQFLMYNADLCETNTQSENSKLLHLTLLLHQSPLSPPLSLSLPPPPLSLSHHYSVFSVVWLYRSTCFISIVRLFS